MKWNLNEGRSHVFWVEKTMGIVQIRLPAKLEPSQEIPGVPKDRDSMIWSSVGSAFFSTSCGWSVFYLESRKRQPFQEATPKSKNSVLDLLKVPINVTSSWTFELLENNNPLTCHCLSSWFKCSTLGLFGVDWTIGFVRSTSPSFRICQQKLEYMWSNLIQ